MCKKLYDILLIMYYLISQFQCGIIHNRLLYVSFKLSMWLMFIKQSLLFIINCLKSNFEFKSDFS